MSKSNKALPEKVNRILTTMMVILILIASKLWHLSCVEHKQKQEDALGTQRRTLYERTERATISDRFGISLAVNKVQYNAAIIYRDISRLPRWVWRRDEKNKRYKYFLRKEHITHLAECLGQLLDLDPLWLEDTIHAKAAILGNVPCVIKENISEESYFRLKMLEKELAGVHAEHVAKRSYPNGRLGSEVIGFLGAISQNKYQSVTRELKELREIIALYEEMGPTCGYMSSSSLEEAKRRLCELEDQAYRITDLVGKSGVEATYDERLRGLRGKRTYLTDRRGNYLRQLGTSVMPTPGSHLQLTISSELQLYAEELLAGFEERELIPRLEESVSTHFPWMKGGAIVVMQPKSGELLALASYPRFDPGDFAASKENRIIRWLENEQYVAGLWDQEYPLERERFDPSSGEFYEESLPLTWPTYLRFLLSENSPLLANFTRFSTVEDCLLVQRLVEKVLSYFTSEDITLYPSQIFNALYGNKSHTLIPVRLTLDQESFLEERISEKREELRPYLDRLSSYFFSLPYNGDKLLYTDLCRIVVDESAISNALLQEIGKSRIEEERQAQVAKKRVEVALQKMVASLFEKQIFAKWREDHFKEYLREKREEERQEKRWARPYLAYLQAEKERQFTQFWEENKATLLHAFLIGESSFEELALWAEELLLGAHKALAWTKEYHYLRKRIEKIPASLQREYLASMRSFEELKRPLLGSYSYLRGEEQRLEKHLASAFYPKHGFGYMRSYAFQQATTAGSVFKVVCSYEVLKQRYLALQGKNANFANLNPLTMVDDKHKTTTGKWNVGYTLEGKPIPLYYKGGRLPRSEHRGIGKVDLLRALETSSNPYFSLVAGTVLDDPEDLCQAAALFGYGAKSGLDLPGEYKGHLPKDVAYNRTGLYSLAIGQHSLAITPLQSAVMLSAIANGGSIVQPHLVQENAPKEPRWHIFMPDEIHHLLLTGLKRVVRGEKGTARSIQSQFPKALINNLVGKTSTAEEMEKVRLDGKNTVQKVQHISFGSIFYDPENPKEPELVIIVYLRHGRYGRLAAPLAAKIAERWLSIKNRHSKLAS